MILVTLGTHPRPMDRVVETIDELLELGALDERVIIQAARFTSIPRYAEAVGVAGYETIAGWAREASVIVTHGGPGSIMLALAAGRHPVVVPRQARYGEHVDDHQLRFARWIAPRRGLQLVEEVGELGSAIEAARGEATSGTSTGPTPEVIERLRLAIEGPRTAGTYEADRQL